jgi:monovalent cation:proton antiporter-2 (CPA2) family protein
LSEGGLLQQAAVYLGAAVVAVPIASRLGLGSVLGTLLAGVAIGPWVLGLVAEESTDVMHFAELGVVMMLFLVGLELDPSRLWKMRIPVFGLGGLQVGLTALLVTPLALLAGLPLAQAVAVGLIVAMSSTAIALQSLGERGQLGSPGGQTAFAVLLLQDVAVIPILAMLPLLATLPVEHVAGHEAWIDTLPAWQRGAVVVGAVGAVVLAGRVAVGPLMRAVARTGLRELFTASALLIVVSVALLMGAVGLSAALGTFVAGVVLANSEYRHELVSDVEPFKGLLLGLFFMAVGASIDFAVLAEAPVGIGALVASLILVKLVVLALVARLGGLSAVNGSWMALSLAQVGEFAFVLFNFAEGAGVLPIEVVRPLVAATAFSMALTPFLLSFHARVLLPRLIAKAPRAERAADAIDESNPVLIAGYGRFGQIAGRLLRSQGIGVTVLDVDAEQVDMVRKYGQQAYYGDASRLDVLHAAGAHQAKVLLIAVDQPEKVSEIVHVARRYFPQLAVLARARGRTEAIELVRVEVEGAYRETFDAALRAGGDALRLLGLPGHTAHRAAERFRSLDEALLAEMVEAESLSDAAYITLAKARLADFERLMRAEGERHDPQHVPDWEGDALRRGVLAGGLPPAQEP